MKKLNEKGMSVIEVVMTFVLIMIIVSGLLTIIMNYRQRAQIEMKRLELVTYKNEITKEIQNDILERGIYEINTGGLCIDQQDQYSSCSNLVFKDGVEKILAVSKLDSNNNNELVELLNNKYIRYGDTKYPIEDELPSKIPTGRSAKDFQSIYINNENFLTTDSVILQDGKEVKIYSIDIYIEHIDYEDDFGIHIVATDNDVLSTSTYTEDFTFTGNVQEYTIPANGTYKIELWGASGGDKDNYSGGLGAYTSGYTYLTKGTTLYLYIGGAGIEGTTTGGYNGGGSINSGQEIYGSPGGGSTDVRTVGGTWDDFESLKSRIMVAAGGGGANNRNINSESTKTLYGAGNGGAGGGLVGYAGESVNYGNSSEFSSYNQHSIGTGGTQTSGGQMVTYNSSSSITATLAAGTFGKALALNQSGAGGGWFTGGYSNNGAAGGGSSYISGHNGCMAINQTSTESSITMKSSSEYEGYFFSNTLMIDGEGYAWTDTKQAMTAMPTYDGKTDEAGNKGNGHIRITYLGL